MSSIKTAARASKEAINRARLGWRRWRNSRADTQQVFNGVYRRGDWGGDLTQPFSGAGSRGHAVQRYVETIAAFITNQSVTSIVDIGCGDFFVGSQLLDRLGPNIIYLGLDVSSVVIDHNTLANKRPNARFLRLDAAKEDIPPGDLCLVRQVMQHLSNAQIAAVLRQLMKFKYTIVTEHQPLTVEKYNTDKPHGGDTRLVDKSAVFLDKPPFNVAGMRTVLEVVASIDDPWDGKLTSFLIEPHTLGPSLPPRPQWPDDQ
jgi:SAM-dependent methyltransferase